jgi:thiamine biosynthesis lipoprotein
MGTVVTIRVVSADSETAIGNAFSWFHEIEERCTRFDARSELMQLTAQPGIAVPASAILYEAVRFAVLVAAETHGAFDPTVGHRMEARGFNREHRTGTVIRSAIAAVADATYRDVELDPEHRTITLRRPLTLDLGAVAKGLAVDAAARELEAFRNFSIDAGGDLYLGGMNEQGEPWRIGIRHPRRDGELIETLRISNKAVCTSGDYERGQHILDGRGGESGRKVASATVVGPGAMLADALATAAFVMGPEEGIELLNRMGVDGLIVTPELERYETRGLRDLMAAHAA